VVASANGIVIDTGYDLSYGNYVVIKHGFDFYTRYAHLQRIIVKERSKIVRGEILGMIGNTGLSTGPHLHYEIIISDKYIDPYKYMILTTFFKK